MGKPGAKEVTGRFSTREELKARVVNLKNNRHTIRYIAEDCRVAEGTVCNLLKETQGGENLFDKMKNIMLYGDWKNVANATLDSNIEGD